MRVNVKNEKRSKWGLLDAASAKNDDGMWSSEVEMPTKWHSRLQLKCMNNTTFDVTYEQAMISSTLWGLMQDVSSRKSRSSVKHHVIQIIDVPAESVQRALEYCSCLYKQQVDRKGTSMLNWEEEFVSLESKELCDLAKVASKLDIQPLVDLTCQSIAQIMSATSEPDELRKKFRLEDAQADADCSCELRNDMAGFDFDMFNVLDHDLSTDKYELVEFDQPSVDELVTFINGSNSSNPNTTPNRVQQHQAALFTNSICHFHGEISSDPGSSTNGSITSGKKKRKKRKKKKLVCVSPQCDRKAGPVDEPSIIGSSNQTPESSSSDEEKQEPVCVMTKLPNARHERSIESRTLEEKVRLAQQNPSAVFKESQFEDDDDEDMAKVIKMFELNLLSAYRDCGNKEKLRLNIGPREVFQSSLMRSSQFEYMQHRLSPTMM